MEKMWEVRSPLVYGSKHEALFATETEARKFAEELSVKEWNGEGLQIHTASRTIYIDHPDD